MKKILLITLTLFFLSFFFHTENVYAQICTTTSSGTWCPSLSGLTSPIYSLSDPTHGCWPYSTTTGCVASGPIAGVSAGGCKFFAGTGNFTSCDSQGLLNASPNFTVQPLCFNRDTDQSGQGGSCATFLGPDTEECGVTCNFSAATPTPTTPVVGQPTSTPVIQPPTTAPTSSTTFQNCNTGSVCFGNQTSCPSGSAQTGVCEVTSGVTTGVCCAPPSSSNLEMAPTTGCLSSTNETLQIGVPSAYPTYGYNLWWVIGGVKYLAYTSSDSFGAITANGVMSYISLNRLFKQVPSLPNNGYELIASDFDSTTSQPGLYFNDIGFFTQACVTPTPTPTTAPCTAVVSGSYSGGGYDGPGMQNPFNADMGINYDPSNPSASTYSYSWHQPFGALCTAQEVAVQGTVTEAYNGTCKIGTQTGLSFSFNGTVGASGGAGGCYNNSPMSQASFCAIPNSSSPYLLSGQTDGPSDNPLTEKALVGIGQPGWQWYPTNFIAGSGGTAGTTNPSGSYSFTVQPSASCPVSVQTPTPTVASPSTYSISGNIYDITTGLNVPPAIALTVSIVGEPWGTHAAGITPATATVTPRADGSYTFTGLTAGGYLITLGGIPSGYSYSSIHQATVAVGPSCDSNGSGATCN